MVAINERIPIVHEMRFICISKLVAWKIRRNFFVDVCIWRRRYSGE